MREDEGEDEHEEHKREDEENIDTIIPVMILDCHWHPPGVMRPADLHYNLSAQETETPQTPPDADAPTLKCQIRTVLEPPI